VENDMGLLEHWPTIISAVCVGGVAIFVRHYYLSRSEFERFKTDCEKMRTVCQTGTCKMIQATKISGKERTDALNITARDNMAMFNLIRKEISEVKTDVSGLRERFEQYLKDTEKRNSRSL